MAWLLVASHNACGLVTPSLMTYKHMHLNVFNVHSKNGNCFGDAITCEMQMWVDGPQICSYIFNGPSDSGNGKCKCRYFGTFNHRLLNYLVPGVEICGAVGSETSEMGLFSKTLWMHS